MTARRALRALPDLGTGDHAEWFGMVRRMLKSAGKRVAASDPDDLAELVVLREHLDQAIHAGVEGQRAAGFSWGDIAQGLGVSKQYAQRVYGATRD